MTAYDLIADDYEKFFNKDSYAEEDLELSKMLPYPVGKSVLDIGCGAGLGYVLLMFKAVNREFYYLGIDPSEKMLEKFSSKNNARTLNTGFEEYSPCYAFDIAISTYGSISYVEPSSIQKLKLVLKKGGRFFLVFYKDDYTPITHEIFKDVVKMSNYKFSDYKPFLEKISQDVKFKDWHNYIIAEGTV